MTAHANEMPRPEAATPEPEYVDVEEQSTRVSRWTSILYLVLALATPLLLVWGPDVMTPAIPAIADAAADGRLTLRRNFTVKPAVAAAHAPETDPHTATR